MAMLAGHRDTRRAHRQETFDDAIATGPLRRRVSTEDLVWAAIARAVADMVIIDTLGVIPGESVAKYGVDCLHCRGA